MLERLLQLYLMSHWCPRSLFVLSFSIELYSVLGIPSLDILVGLTRVLGSDIMTSLDDHLLDSYRFILEHLCISISHFELMWVVLGCICIHIPLIT